MTNSQDIIKLTLNLSPEINQILEELAHKIGGSKSDVIHQAIKLMQVTVTEKEASLSSASPSQTLETLSELHPWTQSLIGVINLESENLEDSYVNYLEEKYS
jgi:Arc/MetJ-type ribon-helix-helix transcriptional regulator